MRRRSDNGIRMIGGRQYLLAGRAFDPEHAKRERAGARERWKRVRCVKLGVYDYAIYVHGERLTNA